MICGIEVLSRGDLQLSAHRQLGDFEMTSDMMGRYRRSAQLATVIGAVLATYAVSAVAVEFEFDNGGKLNWNTTVSVGSSAT